MSRPLRLEYAGALYHVTSRGDRREDIYETDSDRRNFISILGDVCDQFNWRCHAYCLMTNHYHLLIETPDANLSKGMRQLNGVYSQSFNKAHGRVGHVFQGRYKAIHVEKETYLLELARYIVLNPVRAKMISLPHEWPWSSYRATVGLADTPFWLNVEWLLSHFDIKQSRAIRSYEKFVLSGQGVTSPLERLKKQVYLGSDEYMDKLNKLIHQDKDLSEIPTCQRRKIPKSIEEYARISSSRNEAIFLAYKSGGYRLKEIADYFSLHYTSISRIVKKMHNERLNL